MEECAKLAELRREVKDELEEWQTGDSRGGKREKGDVGVEKDCVRIRVEGDKMESFFCTVFWIFVEYSDPVITRRVLYGQQIQYTSIQFPLIPPSAAP